jgi:hypothetical protein
LESVEVTGAATEFTFDVCSVGGSDTESNRPVVFGEQAVAFLVIHHHRVRLVDVWIGPPPPVIFVAVIGFEFTECLVDDELSGVVDVVGVVNDGRFDIVPLPPSPVKSIGFVADAASLKTAHLQVVVTPRLNV